MTCCCQSFWSRRKQQASQNNIKGSISTSNTIHLINEEKTHYDETEEDAEGYKSGSEDDEDVDLLMVDVENDILGSLYDN